MEKFLVGVLIIMVLGCIFMLVKHSYKKALERNLISDHTIVTKRYFEASKELKGALIESGSSTERQQRVARALLVMSEELDAIDEADLKAADTRQTA
ncbi:hypothetical protein [Pseudoalteromonas ulvae]|uniref:Uncharacterized protein n=1 Tax=Pseudoalteromonas ulvae TaxID=107327 RepID=A0A244CUH4_PSEDV|nr:hypothetical protein [Pseudoalteromonas ulvae]OUL59234.1 hypothetical protein B1199_02915 [Pseudoalteromonas ulvae]